LALKLTKNGFEIDFDEDMISCAEGKKKKCSQSLFCNNYKDAARAVSLLTRSAARGSRTSTAPRGKH
jgi:hypothetical protein